MVERFLLARGVVLETQHQVPHQAPCMEAVPNVGLDAGSPGPHPGLKGRAQPLSPSRCP